MARPIRIQYPDAVYHIMARGNHGQAIFQDEKEEGERGQTGVRKGSNHNFSLSKAKSQF